MAAVDGLISGMSTSQVISQLMQAEAAPQTQLKGKVTAEQKVVTAYQSVNTKMAALKAAATALTQSDTWKAVKATSSSTSVVANAAAGAAAGTLTFNVTSVAKAHSITSVMDTTQPLTTGAGLDITGAGLTDPLHVDIDPAETDPQVIADAINDAAGAAGATIKASVITTDQGTMLQVNATKTGLAASFDIAGLTTAPKIAAQGTDATITVGNPTDPTNGGYTISSPTNTFSNAINGVTFTVSKEENNVTVDVAADSGSLADKMQAMVDAANNALSEISKQSAYDPTAKVGGPLTSDFTVRELQQNLLSGVSTGGTDYGSFKQLGVQLDSSGKLTFDRSAFLAAYGADPSTIQTAVSDGLAKSMNDISTTATDTVSGNLTLAIQGGNDQIKDLNDRVADWDVRLADKQSALQRQFADLEVALGKLKDQSGWLSSQIASLPSGG